MAESLRYYIAHNGGFKVMENRAGSMNTIAEFSRRDSGAFDRLHEKA